MRRTFPTAPHLIALSTTFIGRAKALLRRVRLIREQIAGEQDMSGTEQVTFGDLDARLFPSSRDEVGQLTRAFNCFATLALSLRNRQWAIRPQGSKDQMLHKRHKCI